MPIQRCQFADYFSHRERMEEIIRKIADLALKDGSLKSLTGDMEFAGQMLIAASKIEEDSYDVSREMLEPMMDIPRGRKMMFLGLVTIIMLSIKGEI